MSSSARIAKVLVAVVVAALACFCLGCSGGGSSYSLTKDASLKCDWGAVLQYKVDPKWTEPISASSLKDTALAHYTSEDKKTGIGISIEDTNSSSYKYSVDATYADWTANQEKFYTRTAEEWAKESTELAGEKKTADDYPDYKDFSLSELGTQTVDGVEFRLYKMNYTVSYSDAAYAKAKEKNSDLKQTEAHETYYAIVKDGTHDAEIYATGSEKLLKDFLGTLSIKW